MGKKKKKKYEDGYGYEDDRTFSDPAELDRFISELVSDGNLHPASTGRQPKRPLISNEALAAVGNGMSNVMRGLGTALAGAGDGKSTQPRNVSMPDFVTPLRNPNTPETNYTPPVPVQAYDVPTCDYGVLRFSVMDTAYGKTMAILDSFGNMVSTPIQTKGIDENFDNIDATMVDNDLYHLIYLLYSMIKLRFVPDMAFPISPEGIQNFVSQMQKTDKDSVFAVETSEYIACYLINRDFITKRFAPGFIRAIKKINGNAIGIINALAIASSVKGYFNEQLYSLWDLLWNNGQAEVIFDKFCTYTTKYCKAENPAQSNDFADFVDSSMDVFADSLAEEFHDILVYYVNGDNVENDEMASPGSLPSYYDPNAIDANIDINAAALLTEYGASPEREGAAVAEDPFPATTDKASAGNNDTSIDSSAETGKQFGGGTVIEQDDGGNIVTAHPGTNTARDDDGTSSRESGGGNIDTGGARGYESPSCTTNIGAILQALEEEKVKEEETSNDGGSGGSSPRGAGSEAEEKGPSGVQSSGAALESEEKDKKEEEKESMVIAVRTCGK